MGNAWMTREDWYKLPADLRLRWWEETKFDRLPPSAALLAAVQAVNMVRTDG